ncbi:MAG: MATE family efflux transporter, partial [Pseudomonadota bacterium]
IAALGLSYVIRQHDLLAMPSVGRFFADGRALLAIAAPAVATQLSTPFGNAYLTRIVAEHGDEAVAGWAVVGRLSAVAFGGLFALSGAVGPILGQNRGAGRIDRIQSAYRDALIFTALYTAVVWAVLWLSTPFILQGFGVQGPGVAVLQAFTTYGAAAWLFSGWLFVSNAACNNLGRPVWSTGFNWTRDGAVIPLLALAAGTLAFGGAAEAVMVQAIAALLMGSVAVIVTRRYLMARLDEAVAPAGPVMPPVAPFASGRVALAGTVEGAGSDVSGRADHRSMDTPRPGEN